MRDETIDLMKPGGGPMFKAAKQALIEKMKEECRKAAETVERARQAGDK